MDGFAEALGSAIRATRTEGGHSMGDIARSSLGRFSVSALGGYERGERDISVEKLVELAAAMHVRPEDLIARALERLTPKTRTEAVIDLRLLSDTKGPAADAVGRHARRIQLGRGDLFADVITIRSGDLQVIAADAGLEASTLLDAIRPAVVRIGPNS